MIRRKLSAGDTMEAKCTRCRTVLNHTIVAMVEERVVRVQCNTCNGMHNYHEAVDRKARADGSAPRKVSVSPRKAKVDPEELALQEWELVRADVEKGVAVPYSMDAVYRIKTIINHPIFGMGMVKQLMPHKIEVIFRGGTKLLRCA